MDTDQEPLQKVHPDQFRKAVERGGTSSVSILIEILVPLATVDFAKKSAERDFGAPRSVRISPPKDDRSVADIVAAVEKIVGETPAKPYGSTSVLVVNATSDQIRRLAGLDGVKEIWPNERVTRV